MKKIFFLLLFVPLMASAKPFVFGGTYEIPLENEQVIAEVAEETGVYPADLLAICIQESGCGDMIVGHSDYGKALGFFQIHDMHGVSDNNRSDLYESALWTANNLLRHGYSKVNYWRRFGALWRHNGMILQKEGITGNIWYPQRVVAISNAIHRDNNFFNPL